MTDKFLNSNYLVQTVNQKRFTVFSLTKKRKGGFMEEEKRVIKEPPHKQLIMNIGKTKYTVNLNIRQGTGETGAGIKKIQAK